MIVQKELFEWTMKDVVLRPEEFLKCEIDLEQGLHREEGFEYSW